MATTLSTSLIGTLVQAASPLLDPPTRAVLLMALLAFVLLGRGVMLERPPTVRETSFWNPPSAM